MASEIKQGTLDLINHLPILQVITPMLIAPILIVLNNKTLSWLLSFVGALGCLIISLLLIHTSVLHICITSEQFVAGCEPLRTQLWYMRVAWWA